MTDLARRFNGNPLLRPGDIKPTRDDFEVACLFNPGAFRYAGKVGLLLRVAERPKQEAGWVSTPVLDASAAGGMRILRIRLDDPDLKFSDPRGFEYQGVSYVTTLSHLHLAWSDDGSKFVAEPVPALMGAGPLEAFGIEDCRVSEIEGRFQLTYTAASTDGFGVGRASTTDWRRFERHGMIFPPANKDCALFPQKIGGLYYALHRPSGVYIGGSYIWVASSPDLRYWGDHHCILRTRRGLWDEGRVGAGAAPVLTDRGWLEIYHGATHDRYCLGAVLLDTENPARVLARLREPVMEPSAEYELKGFVGNTVFTNGQVVDGDTITLYYGASDEVICGARFSIAEVLRALDAK